MVVERLRINRKDAIHVLLACNGSQSVIMFVHHGRTGRDFISIGEKDAAPAAIP